MNGNRFSYWEKGFSTTEIKAANIKAGCDRDTLLAPDFAYYLTPATPLPREAISGT